MSFDQETDAVVFGCIGKASLEANLWIVHKDSHFCFKEMVVILLNDHHLVHELDDTCVRRPIFICANRNSQIMFEQYFCIASIVSDFIAFQLSVDWFSLLLVGNKCTHSRCLHGPRNWMKSS